MIFVDSSAWIGIVMKEDQYHEKAVGIFDRLTESWEILVTTDYILSETYTYLRYHTRNFKQIHTFNSMIQETEEKKLLLLRWVTEKTFKEAGNLFIQRLEQGFSFVDCVSFVVAKELKITDIFSFDRDFTLMGFKLLH